MPTFVVSPKDLGRDLVAGNERMKARVVEVIQTAVAVHAPRIAQATINTSTPRKPVDRGTYRRSFKTQKLPGGATFYNFAAHAEIIEKGRRPHQKMPPVDVILAWVKRKRIGATFTGPVAKTARAFSTIGGRAKAPGARKLAVDAQQRRIALYIARKIGARGLPAHHILEITEQVLSPIVQAAIDEALSEA